MVSVKTIAALLLLTVVLAEVSYVVEAAGKSSTRRPFQKKMRRRLSKRKMGTKSYKSNEPFFASQPGFAVPDSGACKKSAFISNLPGSFDYMSCSVVRRQGK